MKRVISSVALVVLLSAPAAGAASGAEGPPLTGGTSKSGKNLTLRVPVKVCGHYYEGGVQITAGLVCDEPVEHSYKGGFAIVKKNRCAQLGRTKGRPLELLRTWEGATEVFLTRRAGSDGGNWVNFDPREKYGFPSQEPFPPGEYSIRVKEFSYRGKVYKESNEVFYHDTKIICEKEELKLGPLPSSE